MKKAETQNVPPSLSMTVFANSLDSLCKGLATVPKGSIRPVSKLVAVSHIVKMTDDPATSVISTQLLKDLWGTASDTLDGVQLRSLKHRANWFRTLHELFLQFLPNPQFNTYTTNFRDAMKESQLWPADRVVQYIKYLCIAPHARFFGEQLPEEPQPFVLRSKYRIFGGCLGRWMQHRLVQTKSRFSQHFFYSWFQTKRGCDVMDETDIQASFEKHKKALSRIPDPLTDHIKSFIVSKTKQVLRKFSVRIPETVRYEFSHNACFDLSIKRGGAITSVQKTLSNVRVGQQKPQQKAIHIDEWLPQPEYLFFRKVFGITCAGIMMEFLQQDSEEFRHHKMLGQDPLTQVPLPNREEGQVQGVPQLKVNYSKAHEVFEHRNDENYHSTVEEVLARTQAYEYRMPDVDFSILLGLACTYGRSDVMVAPVLEPLKVRLVSKGDALTYAASMPLQKAMHSYLRRFPQFALIGEPLGEKHLNWLSNSMGSRFVVKWSRTQNEKLFWNSGDYSAATDGLSIEVTKQIFECFLQTFDPDDPLSDYFAQCCRNVLYEQEINYPGVDGHEKVESFRQTCGQLMGSTLSFPVLCLANLLSYWIAWERFTQHAYSVTGRAHRWRPARFENLPVLVNGDDILFLSCDSLQKYWEEEIKVFGFALSAGKSLKHPYLATANSMQWRMLGTHEHPRWELIEYLNLGLLIRGSSGKIAKTEETMCVYAPVWNKLRHGVVDEVSAFTRFLYFHGDKIRDQTLGGLLNFFGDPASGSLGFDLPKGWEYKFTTLQRALCYERKYAHLRKPFKAPVVCRIDRESFPNATDYVSTGLVVGCRPAGAGTAKIAMYLTYGDQEYGFPQSLFDKGWIPDVGGSLFPNSSYDRLKGYLEGSIEEDQSLIQVKLREILPLIRSLRKKESLQLASDAQMFEHIKFVPVLNPEAVDTVLPVCTLA